MLILTISDLRIENTVWRRELIFKADNVSQFQPDQTFNTLSNEYS